MEVVALVAIEEGGSDTNATVMAGVLDPPPPPPPHAARPKVNEIAANNFGPVLVRLLRENMRKLPE
jgi:hypothetical protein